MPIFQKRKQIVDVYDTNTGMNTNIDRKYCFLMVGTGDPDGTSGEFAAIEGRKDAFNFAMNNIANGNYDLTRSWVLNDKITFSNETSIYTFIRLCIEVYKYDQPEQMDYINQIAIETSLHPDKLTIESLDRWYNQECRQSARG